MDMSREVPTVWNQLAETMYLKDSPTAAVSLSELASFSFGRFQSSKGLQTSRVRSGASVATLLRCNSKLYLLSSNSLVAKRYRVVFTQLGP
jgi:hypothetical protein